MPIPEFVIGLLFVMNVLTGESVAQSMLFETMEQCQAASAEVAEQVRQSPDEIMMIIECHPSSHLQHPKGDA